MLPKLTISHILDFPSMRGSYIVAGHKGIARRVKRIDILDLPYPEVCKYLEPGELMLTSFWNSRYELDKRIGLVRAMVEKGCAGLGIMPSICLGSIDKELINIGNSEDFPIIYLPETTRWSDIILDFGRSLGENTPKNKADFQCRNITQIIPNILEARRRLFADHNINLFLKHIYSTFGLTMVVKVDKQIFTTGKSHLLKELRNHIMSLLISLPEVIDGDSKIILYKLNDPYLAHIRLSTSLKWITVFEENKLEKLDTFLSVQSLLIEAIEAISNGYSCKDTTLKQLNLAVKERKQNVLQMFICIMRLSVHNLRKCIDYFNRMSIQLIRILPNNTMIIGIPGDSEDDYSIYHVYRSLLSVFSPSLFIFSSRPYYGEHLEAQVTLSSLLLTYLPAIDGIYEIDELLLLYAMYYLPYHIKETYYTQFQEYINANKIDPDAAVSLRLYLILRSGQVPFFL